MKWHNEQLMSLFKNNFIMGGKKDANCDKKKNPFDNCIYYNTYTVGVYDVFR